MSQGACVRCDRIAARNQRETVVRRLASQLAGRNGYAHMYRLVGSLPLCGACLAAMPVIEGQICEQCGRSLAAQGLDCERGTESSEQRCRDCRSPVVSALEGNRGLLRYDAWGKDLLGLYKYRGDERLAHFFGMLLALAMYRYFQPGQFDCLVAVPLHEKRLQERGFNQMERISQYLSRVTGVPVQHALIRTKDTPKLSKQNGRDVRIQSMKDAFSWREEDSGKRGEISCFLLLDDIYTTGSTLRACAKAIQEAQTVKTYIWSLTIFR
ncbi:ComF family protein [Brevibacillus invocatus]|uniref:ComF family protein n=1 Tax=Brevibacillus invocatus TaxID=173959 RepID=UPI00203B8CBC|nr:ComF family protein [Brevibacillus invocatus]MCM3079646.1 ComF family protein [Brevibacillus invocatus]MCM3431144.1 ComF family protein [Brevibacillus invocatus]